MATRKQKPRPAGGKAAAGLVTPRVLSVRAAPQRGGNPQQLIREAAWSRMFGRTDAKNPFTK